MFIKMATDVRFGYVIIVHDKNDKTKDLTTRNGG